ncbi:glycosyltransferase family 2 protein [Dyadobacter psychrotolerans]|uniref:glycosyltransferase family 2 protein n=1 Tax=Dyadobacter psychrotolerans TaxID=2541721 RepID=UPI001404375F|nr:glycosyltransferase family 2 protein [Dyadobacter psychrotolerans]
MKEIALLLTCHNRVQDTVRCLDCLYSCILPEGASLEVFLVDDGSSDGTEDKIRLLFPFVNVIKGSGNLFWNRGMHLAWKTAIAKKQYNFYLWLNDDTFLFPNAIQVLIESYNSCREESIVCGSTCSKLGNDITYGGFSKIGNMLLKPNGELQSCDFFNGNCVLIPNVVVKKIGILDNNFHHALGDMDYGRRAAKENIGLFISPLYVGTCEKHEDYPKWCSPKVPVSQRFKHLYKSSCDSNPLQLFIFENRHHGFFMAAFHLFTINLRALIPQIYNQRKKI